jgi:adenylate cyclase
VWELMAEGRDRTQRWKATLVAGKTYVLGRDPSADLIISWDPRLSRQHVSLECRSEDLQLRRLPSAMNPVFANGQAVDAAAVRDGQTFVIGSTLFRVASLADVQPRSPVEERSFSPHVLSRIRYQDPENRLAVLTRLPEVIRSARTDVELYERLAQLMLRGVVHADAIAIVSAVPGESVLTRHTEQRRQAASEVRPSHRLVTAALQQKQSMLHVWAQPNERSRRVQTSARELSSPSLSTPSSTSGGVVPAASRTHRVAASPVVDTAAIGLHSSHPSAEASADGATLHGEYDWAFCTPVPALAEEPAALYVTGRMGPAFIPGMTLSEQQLLEADVKFTELIGEILGAALTARRLERQTAGLRQFFAPPVLAALGDDLDTSLLEPRECKVTVMFCDLRGFSQRAESASQDLIGLLERVSRALGMMTQQILSYGGVTGDFQGDAALGFWGWPFASDDAPLQACRAALAIRQAFQRVAQQPEHPLHNFTMGIGLAQGTAVAGKIGTAEQVKVTVFGPVVNLAHRLEGMTKMFRTPILLDESVAEVVRQRLPAVEGRLRKIARVLPYGLETPVLVHELLPPAAELQELTDPLLQQFEQGVDEFIAGRWEEAYRSLHPMPASDRAQDFLIQQILQAGRRAPTSWDGIVRLSSK